MGLRSLQITIIKRGKDNMNKFIGVGTLPRPAILNGAEKQVLRFTLRTHLGQNKKTKKERWAFVPCVVFNPAEETIRLLMGNPKGVLIGLEGRVNTSKFESKGQTKYSTEVIADERSIQLLEVYVESGTTEPEHGTGME